MKADVSSIDGTSGVGPGPRSHALTDTASPGPRLVAALAALLRRYTDRGQVLVGYVSEPGASIRPLAVDLGDDPSFPELVDRVSTLIGEVPLGPGPSSGVVPGQLDGVVGLGQDPPPRSEHDLWLTAGDGLEGPQLVLHGGESAADGRLLGHLRVLLDAAAIEPGWTIDRLPIVTEPELEQLLEWNDTGTEYPHRCLHELIAEQARSTPSAVAVQFEDEQLTYAELDARAGHLAAHLVGLGIGANDLVGICVERSSEMLVGLLGILKAGGAYVPIDPAYPSERQEFMLTSSGATVIVTQERLLGGLPLEGIEVVCLDHDWAAISALPATSPLPDADPEQLAYVIYTSGSTGQPKGVQIPQRALVNFLTTMRDRPGMTSQDILVAVTTLSFDIAGLELYLPLLVGAQVVIAASQTASDPRALAALLERCEATVMQATPTTWRMLIDSGWRGRPGMKALCGGEALPLALADRLVGLGLELWNMYGPTETTIWSTCAQIGTQGETLTIGRPIANTTLYILDRHLEPLPVGVPGELWIGGDGLAHGYRGRPDLTEERFIVHPFDPSRGTRIYRTGDLARFRADGSVEFLGRIDHQVKVRGYRIELGEIESVLTRHPHITEAVVVARPGTGGEPELAAYVLSGGGSVPAHELRQFLGQTLPAYMVPLTVTTLSAFPLTPNGKVDRQALPEHTRERSSEHELVAPRTHLEKQLTAIWERELGVHPVGVTDNFFDLGITSIVAATLFAAIERELGSRLPLGAIFRAPTIESLAALLQSDDGSGRWTSLVPMQPEGSQPPIFCVHGGAGTILHLARLARRLGTDQPFYGLQSKGLYGGTAPLRSVEDMAAHYLSEMRQVHPEGPWRVAGYCFGTIVAFAIAQRLVAEGEEVELLAMFNGPSPAWIKRWGWPGNQPSWRAKRHLSPVPDERERRRRRRRRRARMGLSLLGRVPRTLRHPRRFVTGFVWHVRGPVTRALLALGRPVPERLREQFFFDLHSDAERAYEPTPYPGEILVFYGEGLYEDPTLGWEGLARRGIRSYPVPGEHDNNRQAMREPAVGFISDGLQEYLAPR